ncbi:IclR family transcriptional regulator [Mycobacterium sp. AT1]|uniref:IclR family transcriptional regulator n=1 Tax=Mycobacterium sp. AT1 TaxID=1961706 RepID=UPI0009AC930E|nr:IclR family transcriptional regulator [Mycobacterium sp. AT1]OPX13265.1 hypothetical protein B1790_00935 [Mycobacterium sp. AT1]
MTDTAGAPRRPTSDYHVTALARGLAVLDTFGPDRRELSLRELADAAGVTPASAFRIGFTLVEAGYLIRNTATKGYRLGPRTLSLGLQTLSAMTLPELAEPYLTELRDTTDETIKMAVPAQGDVVIVARLASLSHPTTGSYIGARTPAPISSLGRAVLAWEERSTIDAVLKATKAHRLTPRALPKSALRLELKATRARGYALNDQGTTMEHRSAGAPILSSEGHPIGSINISVSVQRVTLAELERRLVPHLVGTAAAISALVPPGIEGAGRLHPHPN